MAKRKYITEETIERRQINVIYAKNGNGCTTTRLSIPKKFLDKIGISQEKRTVNVSLYKNKIVIERI